MAQQNINYGAAPNDGTGDLYRNAMIKVQNNFTELYGTKVDKTVTIATSGGATGTATAMSGAAVVIPITGLNMGSATAGTLAVARGGTGTTTATGSGSTVLSASPTFTGTPLTTTAAAGTNTTQVASMAAVQAAVSGTLGKTITGGAVTLTAAEVSNNMILFTGALTSNAVITFPNVQRTWAIGNSTTGAFTVTIKGTTAATEELVRGERRSYLIDSAGGMYKADDYTRPVAEGGTGTTTSTGTGSTVLSASPALTGIPTVPTAATATNTTQAASTAFVQAVNSADTGSSATSVALKTARSFSVAGGATAAAQSFNGTADVVLTVTDLDVSKATAGTLAVARGGTGVTTSTGTGSTVLSASPALTGTPTVPTAATATNTTQAASTAFVQAVNSADTGSSATSVALKTARSFSVAGGATAAAQSFNGTADVVLTVTDLDVSKATAGTLAVARGGTGVTTSTGTGSTVLSASPALTGIPTVPTAATATNTTQAASTAFVQAVNSADTGSSATSVALKTARSFSVAGGATAAAQSFNGTADVVLTVTDLDVSKATAGTLAVARGGTGVTTSTGTGSTVLSASPALTGIPTVPTAATATNTTQAASTAFVQAVNSADTGSSATSVALKTARSFSVAGGATAAAQSFNGTADVVLTVTDLDVSKATAGTLAVARGGTGVTTSTGTGSTVLSASPALTGTPTVPTAAITTNNTQAASTAFVKSALSTPSTAADFRIGAVNTQTVYLSTGWVGRLQEWAQALEANGSLAFHSYNTGTYIKPAMILSKDGALEIKSTLRADGYLNPSVNPAIRQDGDLGSGFANWGSAIEPVVQLSCANNSAAYMLWRATKPGIRHLAAMHVHAQNNDTSAAMVSLAMSGDNWTKKDNAFVWYGTGDYHANRNITAGGSITPNSDIRLKNVLSKVRKPMQKIRAIENIIYTRKDIDNGVRYGYSAQSVEVVMPEAIVYSKPGEHQKEFVDDEVKSVDYNGVSVLHNAALVEHDDEITALKKEVAVLKELVERLLPKS